jgi:hypothetical protein
MPQPGQNSMKDIKAFFEAHAEPPLQPNEFSEFWMSLSKEEREEYRNTDLRETKS